MSAAPVGPSVGNVARFAARPLSEGGTPAHVWLKAQRDLPLLDLTSCPEIIVVAAHPDDETLGFGGTAAMLADMGVRVQVVSASDGGASHGNLSPADRSRLEHVRRAELDRAVDALGLPAPMSLGLPDGEIGDHADRLADMLTEVLAARPTGTWCAATWRGDGHPDHEAVGRAAAVAVRRTGAQLVEYPVWMWHWAQPGDDAVPWERAYQVALTPEAVGRKRIAAQLFQSQQEDRDENRGPILPPFVLRSTARGRGGGLPLTARLSDAYFDRMYSESADPWQLQSRWYERRKYAITLALLPYARYRHAFEPGCSVGVLTEQLAEPVRPRHRHRRRRWRRWTPPIAGSCDAGCRERVTLLQASLDEPWPSTGCRSGRAVGGLLLPGARRAARGPGPRGAAAGARRDRAGRALAPSGRRLSDDR